MEARWNLTAWTVIPRAAPTSRFVRPREMISRISRSRRDRLGSSTIRGGRGDSDVVGQIHVVMVGAPGRTRYGQSDRTSARVTHQMARLQSGVSACPTTGWRAYRERTMQRSFSFERRRDHVDVLLVCSAGGHLQLHMLEDAWTGLSRAWLLSIARIRGRYYVDKMSPTPSGLPRVASRICGTSRRPGERSPRAARTRS